MIKSFADRATASLFAGRCPRRWLGIRAQAERKLTLIQTARSLEFLGSVPGNRLEVLRGDRRGQLSIRVNDRWRICFRWVDGDAHEVTLVDYH